MIYNDVEIDAVFATGKESFAIIPPCLKRSIINIVKRQINKNSNSHIKIMLNNFHDERSWINSLKISPRHLQNKAHTARNDHNNPRPPFNFSNDPFRRNLFRAPIRLIKKSRQRTKRRKYRFVSICRKNSKVGCDSKRYCIGSHCSRLFLAC